MFIPISKSPYLGVEMDSTASSRTLFMNNKCIKSNILYLHNFIILFLGFDSLSKYIGSYIVKMFGLHDNGIFSGFLQLQKLINFYLAHTFLSLREYHRMFRFFQPLHCSE